MPDRSKSKIAVERLGGAAGFGSPHLKSRGTVAWADLSEADQAMVEKLFSARPGKLALNTPGERYRITLQAADGKKTVTVPHGETPAALRSSVKDELS